MWQTFFFPAVWEKNKSFFKKQFLCPVFCDRLSDHDQLLAARSRMWRAEKRQDRSIYRIYGVKSFTRINAAFLLPSTKMSTANSDIFTYRLKLCCCWDQQASLSDSFSAIWELKHYSLTDITGWWSKLCLLSGSTRVTRRTRLTRGQRSCRWRQSGICGMSANAFQFQRINTSVFFYILEIIIAVSHRALQETMGNLDLR